MIDHLGFSRQHEDDGRCSVHAVAHALLCLGIPTTEEQLTCAMGLDGPAQQLLVRHCGASEEAIIRGVEGAACSAEIVEAPTASDVRARIDELIRRGVPSIVCAEEYEHWGVIAGRSGALYGWIDSSEPSVIGAWPWPDIAGWLEPPARRPFYAIGVVPGDRRHLRRSLVSNFAAALTYLANRHVQEYWGWYLARLNEIFEGGADDDGAMSADELFVRHGDGIVSAAREVLDRSLAASAEFEMEALWEVADAHRMTLDRAAEAAAVARLSRAVIDLAQV